MRKNGGIRPIDLSNFTEFIDLAQARAQLNLENVNSQNEARRRDTPLGMLNQSTHTVTQHEIL